MRKTLVEHYPDPTAGGAMEPEIKRIDERHRRLISALLTILDLCGFEAVGRIWLRHKATGRDYPY